MLRRATAVRRAKGHAEPCRAVPYSPSARSRRCAVQRPERKEGMRNQFPTPAVAP